MVQQNSSSSKCSVLYPHQISMHTRSLHVSKPFKHGSLLFNSSKLLHGNGGGGGCLKLLASMTTQESCMCATYMCCRCRRQNVTL
jgi:hypothetical protein